MLKTLAAAAFAAVMSVTLPATAHAYGNYPVLTPGAWMVSTANGANGHPYQCTVGFIVRKSSGEPGVLTAGHCRRDPANDAVLQLTPNGVAHVGHYTRWEVVPHVRDIGVANAAPSTIPVVSALDGRPVTRVLTAEDVRRDNPILCKSGARTGLSCGPVIEVTDTVVKFRAWDDLGDSGSPVYVIQPDNTVGAVGVLYAHSDDAQGRIIHATLVAPVMNEWGLTLW